MAEYQQQLARIQALHKISDKLMPNSLQIAQSLIAQFRKYSRLSDKQMELVEKLIARVEKPGPIDVTAEAEHLHIPQFNGVASMLFGAFSHIKWPCIRLVTPTGTKFNLRPAKKQGVVKLTYTGRHETMSPLYITDEKIAPVVASDVLEKLREFAANPLDIAQKYGHETGSCCFCGLTLTNDGSVKIGYGPICAQNYGLPHPLNEHVHTTMAAEINKFLGKLNKSQAGE